MNADLPLKCSCGAVRGLARGICPEAINRVTCYCVDCQSFAYFLDRADEILDSHGGTDVSQMSPARVEFTQGRDHIACMRLSPKGILRWYTSCCNTPIGNTLATPNPPFLSIIHSFFEEAGESRCCDVLGPTLAGLYGRYAVGNPATLRAHDKVPLRIMMRASRKLLAWWLRGDKRRSPVFDAATGKPIARPTVLTQQERGDLRIRSCASRE